MSSVPAAPRLPPRVRRALATAMLLALAGSLLLASAHSSAAPEPVTTTDYRIRAADGTLAASGRLGPDASRIAVFAAPGGRAASTHSLQVSAGPVRVLLRLHGEPLAPFLAAQRRRIAGDAPALSAAQSAALERLRAAHAAELRRAQEALAAELSASGAIVAVHAGFIHLSNTLAVSANLSDVAALRRDPRVAALHRDHVVHATLGTSVPLIDAPALWAMSDADGSALTGSGITIAIIDTGIDYRHPDLGGCFGAGCKVAGGHDFVADDGDPLDDHGHGTHVAGITAADGVLRGVAPDATLLGYKVLDAGGFGLDSDVIAALERAVDPDQDPSTEDRADVINLSLGGPGDADSPTSEAVDNAVLAGSIVVVAAGNSGPGAGSIQSPGNAERAITVAASENFERIAYFSSRGPVPGRDYVKPDLTAPGVQILSTYGAAGYERLSGTSMAAPHVAGAVALLRQREPRADAETLRRRFAAGARDLGADAYTQGAGGIDLLGAVEATLHADPPLLSFGAVDGEQATWTATRTLRLSNVGAATKAVALAAPSSLPAGAHVAFSPAWFLLAPEETRAVQVTLTVDTAVVPYPDVDTLHFEGAISSASDARLRVPFVFRRFDALALTVQGAPGSSHSLALRRVDDPGFFALANGDDLLATHRFELRPGRYYAQSLLWTGEATGIVFRDGIDVPGTTADTLTREEARYEVRLTGVVDEQGVELGDSAFAEYHLFESVDTTTKSGWYFADHAPRSTLLRISAVPDFMALRTTTSVFDVRSAADAQVRYLVSDARAAGEPLGGDWRVGIDARKAGKVHFHYRDAHRLGLDPLSLQVDVSLLSSDARGGFRAVGMGSGAWPTTSPSEMTVYSAVSGPTLDPPFVDLTAKRDALAAPEQTLWTPIAATGMLGFPHPQRHARIDAIDWTSGTVTAMSEPLGPLLSIDDGPTFFASRFFFEGVRHLGVYNTRYAVSRPWQPTWEDSSGNAFPLATDYVLQCADGAAEVSGRLDAVVFAAYANVEVPAACVGQPIDLHLTQSVDVLDGGEPSQVHVRMRPIDQAWLPAPHLHSLVLLDDGVPARVLQGSDPQLELRWQPAYFDAAPQATVEYRLDDAGDWTALDLQAEPDGARATLPLLDSPRVASLRVTLRGAEGDFERQTLNSVFLLGAPIDFRDGFE